MLSHVVGVVVQHKVLPGVGWEANGWGRGSLVPRDRGGGSWDVHTSALHVLVRGGGRGGGGGGVIIACGGMGVNLTPTTHMLQDFISQVQVAEGCPPKSPPRAVPPTTVVPRCPPVLLYARSTVGDEADIASTSDAGRRGEVKIIRVPPNRGEIGGGIRGGQGVHFALYREVRGGSAFGSGRGHLDVTEGRGRLVMG